MDQKLASCKCKLKIQIDLFASLCCTYPNSTTKQESVRKLNLFMYTFICSQLFKLAMIYIETRESSECDAQISYLDVLQHF